MGRNKDSLIALAEKLTGETCGGVLTKKDALKKIACFYAGQEVECNTVADALQCITSHCNGGGSGASGGGGNVIFYGYRMMGMEVLTPALITESINGKLSLIVNKNIEEPTNLTNVEVIEVDGGSVTIKGNVESGTSYGDTLTLSRAEDLDATFYGAASGGSSSNEGNTSGGGESGSVKLTKVYAWFFYQYQSTIYTFTRNPKVGDMAFSVAKSQADHDTFIKIIGVNTDDNGNIQSIDTNSLSGYGYYGEALLFDGYPIVEENGYPKGFVNADNGTLQVNLTFSKANIEPSEHATENKWQVAGIESDLLAYAETKNNFWIGRKVFIVNKDNVAIGNFVTLDDDLESFDVINTENPYYAFYGDTSTLPRTVQLISATVTNAQDYIVMIDGTCVINLTITE